MRSVKQEFGKVTNLVSQVLENHPETRTSDNKLYIKCAQYLGAETLSDLENTDLSIISLHKCRQKLNREGKFLPPQDVLELRRKRGGEVKKYMIGG
ncbi:hypothetical protein ANABIO32_02540 [Rossellomorea marisflavi]|nr:hypothetical protein ANABIO32_02540 [Rossellomorea marisflavi]